MLVIIVCLRFAEDSRTRVFSLADLLSPSTIRAVKMNIRNAVQRHAITLVAIYLAAATAQQGMARDLSDGPAPTAGEAPNIQFDDWDYLTRELNGVGHRVLARLPETKRSNPQLQQEVGRLLLGALASRTIAAIGDDGDHPAFMPWANVYFSPHQVNADTTYRQAIITPGGTYRLTGYIGSLRIAKMWQLAVPSEESDKLGLGSKAVNDLSTLHTDRLGRFSVIISPSRPAGYAGDWWRLDPETKSLWLRQVAYDWSEERDPLVSIERLDVPVVRSRMPAAELRRRLRSIPRATENTAFRLIDHVELVRARGLVNKLGDWVAADGKTLQQIAGFNGQAYYEGAFEIATDEALVIEAEVPKQCQYWSLLLTNDIYETIDWYNNQSSLNGSQISVDRDGKFRVVVSARDPGVANWLDTAGHLSGVVQGRWTECSASPIPTVKKVRLADIAGLLPPDTLRVTTDQRNDILRERRQKLQMRPLW